MQNESRAYLELHIAVFLFGFTAILGDIIQLTALHIVWWRLVFTVFSLLFIVNFIHIVREMSRRRLFQYLGIGVIVAIHWLAFYGSIKLSNASIALICMATTSFFTSLIEPIIMKRGFLWYEIALGVLIVPGMALIVQGTASNMYLGIVVGLLASVLASLFSTLNKKYIHDHKPMRITAIELSSALIFLTILLPIFIPENGFLEIIPVGVDWVWLIVMAIICTTLAYYLSLKALRHLSAFASSLTFNLEPIYGILLALILLNDAQEVDSSFYIGVVIILIAVFSYPIINNYYRRNKITKPENIQS